MTQHRIQPPHVPFFQRAKRSKRWKQPKMCRFRRERDPWTRWLNKIKTKIRPTSMSFPEEWYAVQPITPPTGEIFRLRTTYN